MHLSYFSSQQRLPLTIFIIIVVICGEEDQLFSEHWRDRKNKGHQEKKPHDDQGEDPLERYCMDTNLLYCES